MSNLVDILRQLLKDNEEVYSVVGIVTEIDETKRVCTVQPVDDSAELFDVRLQTSVGGEIGLVLFPKIESEVTVTFLSKELAYIAQTTEIEKIILKIEGLEIFLDKETFSTTVKTAKTDAESYTVTGKKATFTVEQEFNITCQQLVKMQALNFVFNASTVFGVTAANINLAGALAISGAVSINGGGNGGVPMSTPLVEKHNVLVQQINQLKTILSEWQPVPNDGGAALKGAVSTWAGAAVQQIAQSDISNPQITQ